MDQVLDFVLRGWTGESRPGKKRCRIHVRMGPGCSSRGKRRKGSCSALWRKSHIATDERLYPHSRRHHDQVDVKPLLAVETSVLGDRERRGSRSNGGNRRMNFFELLRFGWRRGPKESKE